jgi:CheY-like chemotaxis protein
MKRETRTILLVDGSTAMLYYHGVLLKRLEYEVMTASTPEDALTMMERMLPSLVISAFSFPRMKGADFLKALKGAVHTRSLPVIMACIGMGCAAYLLKPAEPDVLYREIQAALEPTPRANIRLSTSLKVMVGDKAATGTEEKTAFATAISEGGIYLRTLVPQPKNASVPVKLFIKDREIRAKAIVLYTCTLDGGAFREPGMGMKFIEISDDDRDFVRSFIKDQLTSDIMPDT